MKVANCRSCKAPIFWASTRAGKNMPLDVDPVPHGDFYIHDEDHEKPAAYHWSTYEGKLPDVDRYTSHFATCDHPERFRR